MLVSFVRRIVTLEVVVHRMGLGFNLFLMWARGLTTLLLGDQMAVLASDVVCVRLRLLRCPTPGLVVCCGAVTAASASAV